MPTSARTSRSAALGFSLIGTDAGNYGLGKVSDTTASITYAPASVSCLGAAGRTILQPINADGSSVFKQGSTVPAKFRVCDAKGNSIGTPGVVASFKQIQTINGIESTVNEPLSRRPRTPSSGGLATSGSST